MCHLNVCMINILEGCGNYVYFSLSLWMGVLHIHGVSGGTWFPNMVYTFDGDSTRKMMVVHRPVNTLVDDAMMCE